MSTNPRSMVPLPLSAPIWGAFFTVAPWCWWAPGRGRQLRPGAEAHGDAGRLAELLRLRLPARSTPHTATSAATGVHGQLPAARRGGRKQPRGGPPGSDGNSKLDAARRPPAATMVDGIVVDGAYLHLECERTACRRIRRQQPDRRPGGRRRRRRALPAGCGPRRRRRRSHDAPLLAYIAPGATPRVRDTARSRSRSTSPGRRDVP